MIGNIKYEAQSLGNSNCKYRHFLLKMKQRAGKKINYTSHIT